MFFDIGNASFGNIYGQYGTDNLSRSARESFYAETVPNLLTNRKAVGCIGGDFNMIIDKIDASNYPEAKLSPTFKCLMQVFDLKDSYRLLHPAVQQFSRYYSLGRGVGATRIDRCYHYGNIIINYAVYHPLAFSDHHAHVVNITLPESFSRFSCPRRSHFFRINAEVVKDQCFKDKLSEAIIRWQEIRSFGLDILIWWENIVKPGIKKTVSIV